MAPDPSETKLKGFCSKAFNGISITPSGACAPCCLFERPIQNDEGAPFKIWEHDVGEIFNSRFMKDLRRRMLEGETIEACRQCYQIESHGGQSLRQQSNRMEGVSVETVSATGHYMPSFIDLKLNNKCNLKCRMCQPRDSHLIYSEFKKIAVSNPSFVHFTNTHLNDPDLGIPLSDVPDWSTSPVFLEQFKKMIPHINKVSIVGGEPLILNEVFDLLDLMIESGFSKNIYIAFTTNLVHLPFERIQKVLPSFKRILFNISLDAVGEELFYLRYPTKFETVTSNFKELLRLRPGDAELILQFTPTIQVYNVLCVDKVYLFVEKLLGLGIPLSNTPIHLAFLEFPVQLNIRILPRSVRDAAIAKLEALKTQIPILLQHEKVKRNLDQLIHILRTEYITNHDYVPEFLYYSQLLDQERKQSGKTALPELFTLLEGIEAKNPVESYHQTRERGWRLASEGKLEDAIKEFELALETSMNKELDYREMAWMKRSLGENNSALELYEKSWGINPNDHYTLKGLASMYFFMGLQVKLKEILPTAMKFNPDDQELLEISRNLKANER